MLTMRNRLAMLLVSSLGALMSDKDWKVFGYDKAHSRGKARRNPFRAAFSFNKHTPHQGAHEMARRRGGKDWLDARNVSRARRGLPALEG